MINILGHIRNIIVHKYWVLYYGLKLNMNIWQLLKHDLSKLSGIEFLESIKYYKGDSSPIPACKQVNGYSLAWQHHKGHNPHHYEYWIDSYDNGTNVCIKMPYKYVMEMMVDWLAAGRTYQGKSFNIPNQNKWWENKKKNNPAIHNDTIDLIDFFYKTIEKGWSNWISIEKQIKIEYNK